MDEELRVLLKGLVPRLHNLATICDSPFTNIEDLAAVKECLELGIKIVDTITDTQTLLNALK